MLYKAKVNKGGKVAIPSVCRKLLQIKEGQEIVFTLKEQQLVIIPLHSVLDKVRKNISKYHVDKESGIVNEFLAERREEAKYE